MVNFIKGIWRKWFPLYFKVRVRLYSERHGWYIIEYNQGGFNSKWEELMVWHHLDDPTYDGMCWNPMLDEYEVMEKYAKTLTSMKDIRRHYNKEYGIRLKQLSERNKYLKGIVRVKEIL